MKKGCGLNSNINFQASVSLGAGDFTLCCTWTFSHEVTTLDCSTLNFRSAFETVSYKFQCHDTAKSIMYGCMVRAKYIHIPVGLAS